MNAYYNDNEHFAAEWLLNLQAAGHLPAGRVDERSITDVQGAELEGFQQAHFFAGIGGWPLALRLAGWPDDLPVWTGSCPCQPFSVAGKARGVGDERHLWPAFHRLIAECRPPVVFGEQVESKDGRKWIAGVRLDLEKLGYAVGTADLCAAGVGAPNIRQRLFWVADNIGAGLEGREEQAAREERQASQRGGVSGGLEQSEGNGRIEGRPEPIGGRSEPRCGAGRVGNAGGPGRGALQRPAGKNGRPEIESDGRRDIGGLEHPDGERLQGKRVHVRPGRPFQTAFEVAGGSKTRRLDHATGERADLASAPVQGGDGANDGLPESAGFWGRFELVPCADGKARRVEPGTFPLAHGVPGRVGKLCAYGNAIVPQVAAEFVRAYMEVRGLAKD